MHRFSASLLQIPAQARSTLRDRLARLLPIQSLATRQASREGESLPDELLLELLLNLDITSESDFQKAKARYDAARIPGGDELSFEETRDAGWFRVVLGRAVMPHDMWRVVQSQAHDVPAFKAVFDTRFDYKFRATQAVLGSPSLADIAGRVERGELSLTEIGFRDGAWIAARLWERTYSKSTDLEATIREWVDRWQFLGSPYLVPGQVWDATAAESFRQTALNVLQKEAALQDWDETRSRLIKQTALIQNQAIETVKSYVPEIPTTLFDRITWLNQPPIEQIAMHAVMELESISGLVSLLMADVEFQSFGPGPNRIFKDIVDLAIGKPELLLILYFNSLHRPVLLADWLLCPTTSAIACWRIAQWQPPRNPWEPNQLFDANAAVSEAFADAVAVTGYFLERGELNPEEAASLLGWQYEQRPGEKQHLLPILKREITGHSQEILLRMVGTLLDAAPKPGLESRRFIAALDIIEAGHLVDKFDPEPVLSGYVKSVSAGDYLLSAGGVTAAAAASLYELVSRLPKEQLKVFLAPFDTKSVLERIDDENPVGVANSVVKSIRTHARILCRAIIGQDGQVPPELVEALVDIVWFGALDHQQKGRVPALSAKFETSPWKDQFDRPIAVDLAEVLRKIGGESRDKLLNSILETDEPLVLAQMLEFVPKDIRSPIERRIDNLIPSKASRISTLTEVQARIDALLQANLTAAAEQFIQVENDLQTLGRVRGRISTQFHAKLRLLFTKGDWQGLREEDLPLDFPQDERPAAQNSLSFFKGVAELCAPDGKPEVAEAIFTNLQSRHPEIAGYATNLFAAKLQKLLGNDGFARLKGVQLIEGNQLLVDAEAKMAQVNGQTDLDQEIFICNRAILWLALDRPRVAWESLVALANPRRPDRVIAYKAVALSRMNRAADALAIVAEAIQEHGETQALLAARDHIQGNAPLPLAPGVSDNDDPVPSIQRAIGRLKNLGFEQQARVYDSQLDEFVIDQLRTAAAQLTDIASSIRALELDKFEDDLTILYSKILTAQLQHLGWSFPDQTKGGRTSAGNPGERDMSLQKGNLAITVFEAVMCGTSIPGEVLKAHFQKLFAYSTCQILFHVTYSKHKNPASVLAKLKEIAKDHAPPGFKFMDDLEDIPPRGTLPPGFQATYDEALGPRKVVFLLLDLEQHAQTQAAMMAAGKLQPKPKKPRKTKTTR